VETANGDAYEATVARLKSANTVIRAMDGGIETADPWGTRVRLLRA
jgi:catechol 2,3-dioxygenase